MKTYLTMMMLAACLLPGGTAVADITWTTPQLFAPANVSNAEDWRVVFAPDNLSFYLNTERDGHFADTQIYRSTRPNSASAWGVAAPVPELNSNSQDLFSWISQNQTEAYMTRHGNPVPNTFGDIYRTTRATPSDPWGAPALVNELGNSNTFEWQFALTGDGLNGVFSSTRSGGVGGMDLWQTSRASASSPWSSPSVVPGLNSSADERGPFLSADGLTIYFARLGLGLFTATRSSLTGPFSSPTSLPLGSTAIDPSLSPDGSTLYFAMPNGSGSNYDVYYSTQVPEPSALELLAGTVGVLAIRRRTRS